MRCRNNNQNNLTTTNKEVGIRNRSKKRNFKNPTKQEIGQNNIK